MTKVVRMGPSIVTRAIRAIVWLPLLWFTASVLTRPAVRADLGAGWTVFGVLALSLTSFVVLVTTFRSDGVDVGPDGIVIRGFFKPTRVSWLGVACVRVDVYRRLVVLEGRVESVMLVYPKGSLLKVFDRPVARKFGRIVEWWLAQRGRSGLPVPPRPSHPLHPSAWSLP